MPELPEVETVVRDLRPLLTGRSVVALRRSKQRLRTGWRGAWTRALAGQRIEAVTRRGKWIVLELGSGGRLVGHLGMSGQLTVVPADRPVEGHTHWIAALDDGRELRLRDVRRFGSMALFADAAALVGFFEKSRLGPEPFGVPAEAWRARLCGTTRCLKAVLLDQQVLAGVGNIYADEALFEARLHPERRGCDLAPGEADRLREAVEAVLGRAIAGRGSTIRSYVGGSGLRGSYQDEHRVYGRTGKPCSRCGEAIARMRLAGRSTHYCPRCQRPGRARAR